MLSDPPSPSDARFFVPLPIPVSPQSLSVEIPSLGSDERLPRPKRGAPPVAPALTPAEKRRSFRQSIKLGKPSVDPATLIMDAFTTTILSAVAYVSSSPAHQPASAAVESLPEIETVNFDKGPGSCGSCIIA
ncbi:hypothetical protein C8R46DRAFT_1340764 [Mycena filopes]|nr:hypothetical protein C8R46DRAFT_1340764 [Mycena filopes]